MGWSSLVAWIIAACVIAAIIFCYAEVASRFSDAGGAYLFTAAAFGAFVGLQVGWLSYFVRAITAAVQANLFSVYLAAFWPWAGTRWGGVLATTLFIGFLAAVNVRGVRSGAKMSNVFAVSKTVPLLAIGIVGCLWIATGRTLSPPVALEATAGAWLQVLLLLMFAYGGFESAVIPLAEARNPRRDTPFALLVGLGLVMLIYLTTQLTVLATLPDPGRSPRPLADSATMMLGSEAGAIVAVVALLSVYGWLAANMLSVPRLSMAMAERGDFPALFAKVHPVYRSPWVSILIFAGLSWALANQAGLLQNLSLAAVSRLFTYGLVCAALPVLRSKELRGDPDISPALFRAPLGVALAVIGIVASLILATRMNLREGVALTLTVASATAYWAATRRKLRPLRGR